MVEYPDRPLSIAVIGSGISGMSAAWLLSLRHAVTLFERDERIGGHSNTVSAELGGAVHAVDTGFIVYNEATYPNLTALFDHLGVPTRPSEMSFAVSLDGGALEYSGTGLGGLFAQRRNLMRPRFWSMLRDLLRFYREAPRDAGAAELTSIGDYLDRNGYGAAFRDDHLLPMAAAIWSASSDTLLDHPAEAFIRFCDNHGLLKLAGRPQWRTVEGGSRAYVERLTLPYAARIRRGDGVRAVHRTPGGVILETMGGERLPYDHVVIATHADQALAMLAAPSVEENAVLGAFRYARNIAVLHTDERLMPRRRRAWSSWNYIGHREDSIRLCVTYWMNRLQGIRSSSPLFVTLNPVRTPAQGSVIRTETYDHPVFDAGALAAQKRLWSLQGRQCTWFCGAHFGAGFHEDGLQSGLAVAEALGGVRRPWDVPDESGRIHIGATPATLEPVS